MGGCKRARIRNAIFGWLLRNGFVYKTFANSLWLMASSSFCVSWMSPEIILIETEDGRAKVGSISEHLWNKMYEMFRRSYNIKIRYDYSTKSTRTGCFNKNFNTDAGSTRKSPHDPCDRKLIFGTSASCLDELFDSLVKRSVLFAIRIARANIYKNGAQPSLFSYV